MENREQWGSRAGFVLAAIGSAVGLGNIWRFPATAYANGGGSFFIPYLVALLTAGIPLLILEFTMGHKYRGSAPLTLGRISKKGEWIGWWQVVVSFIISSYYSVIIAWAVAYTWFSFNIHWGKDTASFFSKDYAQFANVHPGSFGGIVWGVFIPLILVWLVVFIVLFKGVRKGIEVANKFFIPLLVILFAIVVIRAVTLPGAAEGLNAFFTPDWHKIWSGSVWIAAYGQIFFSLSIAFGIMVAYSSYLPKKSDITNNAFITGFANSGFELLAGIGIFAALGFMAQSQGKAVNDVVDGGVNLVFVVLPQIINTLPALKVPFAVLFFISIIFAGLSSLISIVEAYVSAVQDKFNISRKTAVSVGAGLSALISLVYASRGGLYFLDTVDHYVNQYGIALAGLVEVIFVAWGARKLNALQHHANQISDIRLAFWWKACLGVITPLILGYMMVKSFIEDIQTPYGGYEWSFLSVSIIVTLLAIIIGCMLTPFKWKKTSAQTEEAN
ncbi:transporter [Pullulanibacillus camelliae]|uniref:Transporter n=1 Tax=Pullulanibacillus camelliae TaxID=1707096 RepID=A0A8J2YIR0_9BACL|nr:sodium-dependent transporter [Pullulanibacillus camelliae]GGE45140.1 transporter [Pullulanibacillus camelliae]